jgi:hypothetical protein
MSTTLHIDMAKWAGTEVTGPVTFTYGGATPADTGPAGAVLRMLLAQAGNDPDGLKAAVTAKSMEMGKPSLPGKEMKAEVGAVTEDGESATVMTNVLADGQGQDLTFVVVKEDGTWRVDMPQTIERMMGASFEQIGELMAEGMKAMGDAMSTAMRGLGDGLAEAAGDDEPRQRDPRGGDRARTP